MRWANLSVPTDDRHASHAAPPLPLALPEATVRTFDTPGFAGMTFYEIQAKSLINRVPGASRVPFEWTLNPYRGCSHACAYCLAGDTPILLADGSTRPLAQLAVGDAVYGTTGTGGTRRYVPTTVLAHWSTERPAFRLLLADGTRLVAGGDHRFLTARGWRYVSAAGTDRPAIDLGDTLHGVGGFASPPKESPDYRTGYVCGLIRGDAGHQPPRAPGSRPVGDRAAPDQRARDRTAWAKAAWAKADGFLDEISLVQALRWPEEPSDDWRRGMLAGAYGAIGRTDGRSVQFASADCALLHRIVEALRHLGLPGRVRNSPARPLGGPTHADPIWGDTTGMRVVEVGGDLWTVLRFRHLTGAIGAPIEATGQPVRTNPQLAVVGIQPLGLTLPLYDITTGTGDFIADGVVSHNCFARHSHTYLGLDAGHDFDSKVIVKVNAGELIRRELAAPSWHGAHLAMGTNVDCYQRAEGRYRLMPSILGALRDAANPFSILTKGTLILRDLELLRQAAAVTRVGVSFSIGFVDETVWRDVEPGTPSPRRRLDAVRVLTDAGFPVGVLMAPILPGLTDTEESVDATVGAIATAGATSVTPIALHLRPGAREWYAGWLTRTHPRLAPRYRELFQAGSYLPRSYQREIGARVRLAARRHGLLSGEPAAARQGSTAGHDSPSEQDSTHGSGATDGGPVPHQPTLL